MQVLGLLELRSKWEEEGGGGGGRTMASKKVLLDHRFLRPVFSGLHAGIDAVDKRAHQNALAS